MKLRLWQKDLRCVALVLGRGMYQQCSRRRASDETENERIFCRQHAKMVDAGRGLRVVPPGSSK